ncbi:hypothetical protein KHP62_20445 [Rhodobacteraceae bacterium NNCM2]|nr:hypothetical protein [Coraliihabitans acroporae]
MREELDALDAEVGTEVEVSISDGRMTATKVHSNFERTRRSAEKMAARYARTLELFGR